MKTYSSFTLDRLLTQVQTLNRIKSSGLLGGLSLTQSGLDMCNEELSTIEAELDSRKPEGEFITLLDGDGLPVGFEPIEYGKVELAQDEFNQVDEWSDKGLSVSTFLGQY